MPRLILCPDADQLALSAARSVAQIASESIRERGRFTVALAGGSTPQKTYRLLARDQAALAVDWSKAYLFFGDERYVPPDDNRSNYKMAHDALLTVAPIPADHVFPMPTGRATPQQSAEEYARTLETFFGTRNGQMPVFDLILLGLGDDGHTASLFPGAAALAVNDLPVTASEPGTLPPPVDRITLTYPVLNAARYVVFLVAGATKAEAFRDVWQSRAVPNERPAAGVHPEPGILIWIVDQAAARLIEPDPAQSIENSQ